MLGPEKACIPSVAGHPCRFGSSLRGAVSGMSPNGREKHKAQENHPGHLQHPPQRWPLGRDGLLAGPSGDHSRSAAAPQTGAAPSSGRAGGSTASATQAQGPQGHMAEPAIGQHPPGRSSTGAVRSGGRLPGRRKGGLPPPPEQEMQQPDEEGIPGKGPDGDQHRTDCPQPGVIRQCSAQDP